jgi:heme/copper-type cytochrome/quinol oxidase subunit 2
MERTGRRHAWLLLAFANLLTGFLAPPAQSPAEAAVLQERGGTTRLFSITARRYRFEPSRIEVSVDDMVRIELQTEDIAHSWTVDEYRIAKRVESGRPVVFEFRADRAGTFPFYCSLQTEDGCRRMRGELVVRRPAR